MPTPRTRFADIAEGYDLFSSYIDKNDIRIQASVSREAAACTKKIEKPKLLEIGFGTGKTTAKLLEQIPAARIIALDEGKEFVPFARRNIPEGKRRQVSFLVQDIQSLENRSNTYDAIVSVLTIHNLSPIAQQRFLKKAYELLRTDGALIIGEKLSFGPAGEYKKRFLQRVDSFKTFKRLGHPELQDFFYKHEMEDLERLVREADFLKWLKAVGFKNIVVKKHLGLYSVIVAKK